MNVKKPMLDKISYNDTAPHISINVVEGLLSWHYHPHVEFVVVIEGEVLLEIEGKRRLLRAGDGALMFPFVPHCYHVGETPCKRFMAVFDPQYYGEYRDLFLYGTIASPFFTAERSASVLPSDIEELKRMCTRNRLNDELEKAARCARFSVLLSKFMRICGVQAEKGDCALYRAAKMYIAEHFFDPGLTVGDVAAAVGAGRSKLNSLFTQDHGGVKAYINKRRVKQAETLLRFGNMSIAQVAEESGFFEIRTFNRAFKSRHGITPSQYRKNFESGGR